MYKQLKQLYEFLPKKNLVFLRFLPNDILFGKSYSLWKDKITFEADILQINLYNLLNYVRENTQYGSEILKDKIYLDEVFSYYDSLPFLSSENLVNDFLYYTSKKFSRINSYATTTGGTSRKITNILLSNDSYGIEWSHGHSMFSFANYSMKQNVKLSLRGKKLSESKLIDFNPLHNEVVIDTFRMNKNNFVKLYKELKKYDFKYIHGYPSLVKEFISYMKLNDFTLNLKGVFLNSEGISLEEKQEISHFFNTKVISWYGLSEKVLLAIDIEMTNKFKVYTSYGYPSIKDFNSDGFGEIVGSTFVNMALPLVKYRTGDFGRIENYNNNIFLCDISGRWGKDFVYIDETKKVPTSSINLHGEVQKYIQFYQIHQTEYNRILFKILPKCEIDITHKKLLKLFSSEINKKLSESQLDYIIVNEEKDLYRTEIGKMPLLVQDLK